MWLLHSATRALLQMLCYEHLNKKKVIHTADKLPVYYNFHSSLHYGKYHRSGCVIDYSFKSLILQHISLSYNAGTFTAPGCTCVCLSVRCDVSFYVTEAPVLH